MTEPIKLPPIPAEWQGLWNNGDRPVYRDAHMQEYATLAVEQATAEMREQLERKSDAIQKLWKERDEARAECLEQARLNGMGSEREARLMAQLNEVRRELAAKEKSE